MSLRLDLGEIFERGMMTSPSPPTKENEQELQVSITEQVVEHTQERILPTTIRKNIKPVEAGRNRPPLHKANRLNNMINAIRIKKPEEFSFTPKVSERTKKLAEKWRNEHPSPIHIDTRRHREQWLAAQSSIILAESPKKRRLPQNNKKIMEDFIKRQQKYQKEKQAMRTMRIIVEQQRMRMPI